MIKKGFAAVTGGKIWYRVAGQDKKATALLCLHGGPGLTSDYLAPLDKLSDERPVIRYDQLGSGRSDRMKDRSLWTIEHYVNELEEVRRILKLDRVFILGHSWGSMVAVEYMLKVRPEGVEGLILCGPCLSASIWEKDQKRYISELPDNIRAVIEEAERKEEYGTKEYRKAAMYYYKRHVCRLKPWPYSLIMTFAKMNTVIYEYMWGPSEFTVRGTLSNFERARDLAGIKVPVLFTCGQFDEATPAATAYYQSVLPGSRMAVLEGASHMQMLEKKGEFLKIVRDFLSKVKVGLIAAAILCACSSSFAADAASRPGGNKDMPGLPEREKLVYRITWLGIPVGTATACINGIKMINGRYAYELVITARTNAFCSRIYKVEDRYVSYMDIKELYTLRHEVYRREGRYKKDAVTDFDHIKHKAHYKHLPGGSEKIVDIPPGVQDPVSMAYYFRLVPLKVGDLKKFFVYNNESVYELYGMIDKKVVRRFPYLGVQEAFHLQPYARLKGEIVKKGTARGYFSCDKKQLPLLAIVKGPVFTRVIGYLVREEMP